MDALGVEAGNLLVVETPSTHKTALVRVWLRCRDTGLRAWLSRSDSDALPEVEIDPSLMNYMGLNDADCVLVRSLSDGGSFMELSVVLFSSPDCLSKSEETRLSQFIRHAALPVFPTAEFQPFIETRPVYLRVDDDPQYTGIIGKDTLISFENAADLVNEKETRRLSQEIRRCKLGTDQLLQQEIEVKRKIAELRSDVEDAIKRLDAKNRKKSELQALARGLPAAIQERQAELARLQEENAALQNRWQELNSPAAGGNGKKNDEPDGSDNLDEVRKACRASFLELEKRILNGQPQRP